MLSQPQQRGSTYRHRHTWRCRSRSTQRHGRTHCNKGSRWDIGCGWRRASRRAPGKSVWGWCSHCCHSSCRRHKRHHSRHRWKLRQHTPSDLAATGTRRCWMRSGCRGTSQRGRRGTLRSRRSPHSPCHTCRCTLRLRSGVGSTHHRGKVRRLRSRHAGSKCCCRSPRRRSTRDRRHRTGPAWEQCRRRHHPGRHRPRNTRPQACHHTIHHEECR